MFLQMEQMDQGNPRNRAKGIPSNPGFTVDTALAERWGLDILTAEGEQ